MNSTIATNNIYDQSPTYENNNKNNNSSSSGRGKDESSNLELRKSLLLNYKQPSANKDNIGSGQNGIDNGAALQMKHGNGVDYDDDEFQEIEIPIDDNDDYYNSMKQLNQIIENKDNIINNDNNNNNSSNHYNNNNSSNQKINSNNESFSIDIDSDMEDDDQSDIVDYKSIQPNVIKSKNKIVLVIVSNSKDGKLSLNAKYPRELSNSTFSSSDYLQIKSEVNELKSNLDSLFNRLIVAFSVGGAICIIASLLLWYINSKFTTVGTIVCLSVGVLLWIVFGLFIELKNHYRIQNRKEYFKELNERFGSSNLKFRVKYDKTRNKNPIALIIEYK